MERVKCRNCETIYPASENRCPKCGDSEKIKIFEIELEPCVLEPVTQLDGYNIIDPNHKRNGHKRKEIFECVDRDTVQRGDGITPIHQHIVKDRKYDVYEEVITNRDTGEVIRDCKEPLSEHRGHGTAKFKKS